MSKEFNPDDRPPAKLNQWLNVPRSINFPENVYGHLVGVIPTLNAAYEDHQLGMQEIEKLRNEHQGPALQQLRVNTMDAVTKKTSFSKNMIKGALTTAEAALPPAAPPEPKKDDLRSEMQLREIRDALRKMEPAMRPLYLNGAAKANNVAILNALIFDPCRVPFILEIVPAGALQQAIDLWRTESGKDAFDKLETVTMASRLFDSALNAFAQKIGYMTPGEPVAGK